MNSPGLACSLPVLPHPLLLLVVRCCLVNFSAELVHHFQCVSHCHGGELIFGRIAEAPTRPRARTKDH